MGHSATSNRPGADFHEVASIAGVKTLMQNDTSKKVKLPIVSYKSNRYFVLDHDKKPVYLTFYENGRITREIDLRHDPIIHAHEWVTKEVNGKLETVRKYKAKKKEHRTGLTKEERALVYRVMGVTR